MKVECKCSILVQTDDIRWCTNVYIIGTTLQPYTQTFRRDIKIGLVDP
jgi:hypothetical protein